MCRLYLGAPLGLCEQVYQVQQWSKELKLLSAIGTTQPHAAFAALTHGMTSKWPFFPRTVPHVSEQFQSLEDILRTDLIPHITGRPPPNDTDRKLLALPARLGIVNSLHSDLDFNASIMVTGPLRLLIESRDQDYTYEALANQMTAKRNYHALSFVKAMELAQERGASSWLTTLPIAEHGFCLHKGAFVDALALRYGWPLARTPMTCVCGSNFTAEHVPLAPVVDSRQSAIMK